MSSTERIIASIALLIWWIVCAYLGWRSARSVGDEKQRTRAGAHEREETNEDGT